MMLSIYSVASVVSYSWLRRVSRADSSMKITSDRTFKSLPDCTILSDVTITHPGTKTGSAVVAKHGADAIGDLRDARKNSKYGALAAEIDMEFSSIVLYTYGGFHRSALSFIQKLVRSVDTAACLISQAEFKTSLMPHIALAVQRGNGDIMIQHHQQQRERLVGRSLHRHFATRS